MVLFFKLLFICFGLQFNQYQSQITSNKTCDLSKLYNPSLYKCSECPTIKGLQFSINKDKTKCLPPVTHAFTSTDDFEDCQIKKGAASLDRSRCIECGTTSNFTEKNDCQCNTTHILHEKDETGQYLLAKECLKMNGHKPNGVIYFEDLCPGLQTYTGNSCECAAEFYPTLKSCILKNTIDLLLETPISNETYLFLYSLGESERYPFYQVSRTQSNGNDINKILPEAVLKCSQNNPEGCQALANICALHMYKRDQIACKFLLDKVKNDPYFDPVNFPGQKENVPWLFYEGTNYSPTTYLNQINKIPFEVSFDIQNENAGKIHRFNFQLEKWDINGQYYGMENLTNQLIICSQTYNDTVDFRSFGSTLVNGCDIDLTPYISLSSHKMFFYEMFLIDPNTNQRIDIPILLDAIPNTQDGGAQVNANALKENWILTRRFFTIDNLSSSGTIRYPRNITLHVQFQKDAKSESRIFLPYLQILHVVRDSAPTANKIASVIFKTDYSMDLSNFLRGAAIVFIIMNILVVITLVARMYVWTKLNPSALSPDNYSLWFLFICLMKLFKYWGMYMFFYVWGVSGYWYIFFKMQYRPYVLLPLSIEETYFEYYREFDIIFGCAASVFGLYMFHRIYEQTNYDVFFVDWEHDKDVLVTNMSEDPRTNKYRGAWRGIHIANQFNELQQIRTISIPFIFLWLIMLWYYQETLWMNFANSVPTVSYVNLSPNNIILQFFISTFVLFVAGMVQYAVVRIIQLWLPLKKTEFLDLCCVANISVFILDQSLHGYYIHGQSPLGKADTNLDELVKFLEEEGKGKIRGRGVTDDQNDDLQSYELFLSYNMRTIYDGLYYIQTQSIIDQAKNSDKLHNQSRLTSIFQYIPKSLNIEHVYLLNNYMNSQLKGKIEAVASQSKIFIKTKTWLERFLDFPPSIDLTSKDAKEIVLYKDPNSCFDDVLFMGMEFEWLLFVIYWFQMWTIALRQYGNSFPLAIFLTFICERVLFKIRIFFGEKNVAKKAVIDNRFFS